MKKPPFHVVNILYAGNHLRYDIYLASKPFLTSNGSQGQQFKLKRHEAYAICKLLNKEQRALKWADKFGDPY